MRPYPRRTVRLAIARPAGSRLCLIHAIADATGTRRAATRCVWTYVLGNLTSALASRGDSARPPDATGGDAYDPFSMNAIPRQGQAPHPGWTMALRPSTRLSTTSRGWCAAERRGSTQSSGVTAEGGCPTSRSTAFHLARGACLAGAAEVPRRGGCLLRRLFDCRTDRRGAPVIHCGRLGSRARSSRAGASNDCYAGAASMMLAGLAVGTTPVRREAGGGEEGGEFFAGALLPARRDEHVEVRERSGWRLVRRGDHVLDDEQRAAEDSPWRGPGVRLSGYGSARCLCP